MATTAQRKISFHVLDILFVIKCIVLQNLFS